MRTALAFLLCTAGFAQEFDVASIKVAAPINRDGRVFIGGSRGGPGTTDPTHINWGSTTLLQVLTTAYDVKNYQINAPDWMNSERYDFSVVVPEGATKEQVAVMWRNLLASRFGLTLHKIQKEFQVDELVVGPQGHKLKVNTEPIPDPAAPGAPPPPPPPPPAPGGAPPTLSMSNLTGPGLIMMMRSSPSGIAAQAVGRAQPISALTNLLANQAGHPVVDKTGLAGRYDFTLEFSPSELPRGLGGGAPPPGFGGPGLGAAGPAPAAPAGPAEIGLDLPGALQQQLGLRLVKSKAMLDVLVIDKAEKVPTEN